MKKIDKSFIDHPRPSTTVKVDAGQAKFFVKAIGETNPVYLDVAAAKAAGYRGLPIPPTYLFCLLMMSVENSYAIWDELGIEVGRLLHGEQGFKFHKPVYVGDELTYTPKVLDVQDKKGGVMTMITQRIHVENGEGVHVADLHGVTVVRNPQSAAA